MNFYDFFQKISKTTSTMPGLTLSKIVQWSPAVQFVVVCFGIITSFSIAHYRGDVNANLPFLSETGAFSPELCIFSLTLIVGSFIGCVFMIFRYLIIAENPLCDRWNFMRRNKATLAIGLISMFFLSGVAAFPMTTVFWAHLLTAGGYFFTSASYIVLCTIVTYEIEGMSKLCIFRVLASAICCVFQLILIVVFPLALIRWNEQNEIIPALKTPNDKGFTLLLIASVLEWSVVILIVSYHLSFIFEFRSYKLCLKAKKVASAADGDVAEVPV